MNAAPNRGPTNPTSATTHVMLSGYLNLPLHAEWADAKVCSRCGAKGLSDDPRCADVVAGFPRGMKRTAFDNPIPAISRSIALARPILASDYR
jgi:hypothetical protein